MPGPRSMTGFGRASASVGGVGVSVEVASVNQRGLATSLHLPPEWAALEPEAAARVRGAVQRGKVTVRLAPERPALGTADISEPLAQLRSLAHRAGIPGEPDWEVLLRLSERQSAAATVPLTDAIGASLLSALDAALASHAAMREREGSALAADLLARLGALEVLVARMETSAAEGPARQKERLLRRLADLGVGVDPSDERVLRELALHADRSDVSEEITRLRSHIAQGRSLLGQASPGRALDFLTQELLREVNTVGSKASELATTQAVLEAKVEVERFREQVQNLE